MVRASLTQVTGHVCKTGKVEGSAGGAEKVHPGPHGEAVKCRVSKGRHDWTVVIETPLSIWES